MPATVLSSLGRYHIDQLLARGGMGEVYLGRVIGAHDFVRPVVIKVIRTELVANERVALMFVDAAHDAHDAEGAPLNLVHRDVSPSNVLLGIHGEVKVADFGVAKARSRSYHTVSGSIKGKAPYMAPEQILGEPIDRRADVFSLGVLLFELTTRTRLYSAHANSVAMKHILDGHLPDPAERRPDYPRALTAIVQRAVARHPEDRYPTARAFADDLDRLARRERWNLSGAGVADLVKVVQQRAQLATSTPAWPPPHVQEAGG